MKTVNSQLGMRRNTSLAIDAAEATYKWCWEFLREFKRNPTSQIASERLLHFQDKLGESLYSLQICYNYLAQKRKAVYRSNRKRHRGSYSLRVQVVEKYLEAIRGTIRIGRQLGDSFAWIFYRREKHLLAKHIASEENFHFPTGLGGIGELRFVQGMKKFGKCFVLYHGITNILRLGDVSLIDLRKNKVAGIGELKTARRSATELAMQLTVLSYKSDDDALNMIDVPVRVDLQPVAWPQVVQERLKRQVSRIQESFEEKASDAHLDCSVEGDGKYAEIEAVGKRALAEGFAFDKLSKGLVVVALRARWRRMSDRILRFSTKNLAAFPPEALSAISSLVDQGNPENSIDVSVFHKPEESAYRALNGISPILWWPIDLEVAESILFQEVFLMTFFNSAHLAKELREVGCEVVVDTKSGHLQVRVPVGGRWGEYQGFSHMQRMITDLRSNESTLARMISEIQKQVSTLNVPNDAGLNMTVNVCHDF